MVFLVADDDGDVVDLGVVLFKFLLELCPLRATGHVVQDGLVHRRVALYGR